MRRSRSQNLKHARVSELTKGGDKIPLPRLEELQRLSEVFAVILGKIAQLRVLAIALHLTLRQLDEACEVAHVAASEQLVLQHRAKRRRDGHCELEGHAVAQEPLHHAQERNVGLGDGFEEPVFLEELRVLRMPNEGEMRVQDDRDRTFAHRALLA